MALYVTSIICFFSHVVDVSPVNICVVFRAFVVVLSCLLYVNLGCIVNPSILGLMFMGSVMFICTASCVLYSAESGVHVVLTRLKMICMYFM